MYEILRILITTLMCGSVWHHAESIMQPSLEELTFSRGSQLSASAYVNEPVQSLFECSLRYEQCHDTIEPGILGRSLTNQIFKMHHLLFITFDLWSEYIKK